MWGAIISAVASAAGMAMNAVQNKKARDAQQAEARRQAAYYEAKANENPLTRADNQAVLREYDRNAAEKMRSAQASAAITGATPESVLAQQKQLVDGRADLMSNIAAKNQERVDKMHELAESARQQGAKDSIAYKQERAKSWGTLVSNAGSAFESMDFNRFGGGKNKTTSET